MGREAVDFDYRAQILNPKILEAFRPKIRPVQASAWSTRRDDGYPNTRWFAEAMACLQYIAPRASDGRSTISPCAESIVRRWAYRSALTISAKPLNWAYRVTDQVMSEPSLKILNLMLNALKTSAVTYLTFA